MIDEGDNYQCRLAVPEDIASLANLRWRLCTDDAPVADPNVKKEFIEKCECTLSQMAGHKGIVHFIAETGGTVIAVLSIVKVTKMPSPNDINGQWGYLTNVYTLPEYRNKGIGTALLSEARDWAENEQLELLVVWPSDISYPFYERFGFSRQQREQDPLILIVSNGT
ncbi:MULTISPECIES: GNAT family N-acetyltransferase [Candidatus Fukatsuia]|nr:GNAT family N-acetyltransferase [Candidatus Fukatsuia symbiotica]